MENKHNIFRGRHLYCHYNVTYSKYEFMKYDQFNDMSCLRANAK